MASDVRPKIKLEWQTSDYLFEGIAALGTLAMFGLVAWHYPGLPDKVPTHYNIQGVPDGFGTKNTLLLLPGITAVLYLLLTLVNRRPDIFNFPVQITESNALRQYTLATRMLRWLKAFMVGAMLYILWSMINGVLSGQMNLGNMPIVLLLVGTFASVGWYLWLSYRKKED